MKKNKFLVILQIGTCVIRATTAPNAGRGSSTKDLTININN